MLHRILRRINNIRLRQKLIFSFIIVVFVPVIGVGLFLTNELRDRALEDATRQTGNNVERVRQRMEEALKVPSDISFRLMFDKRLKQLVNGSYEETYEVFLAYRQYTDLSDNLDYHNEIADIRIYTMNPTLINNWEFMRPTEEQTHSEWYKRTVEHKGQIVWTYLENEKKSNEPYLSLTRRIDFDEYQTYAILVIDMSREYLNAILNQEPFTTFLLDDKHYIAASNRAEWIGKTIESTELNNEVFQQGSGTYQVDLNGQSSKVFIEELLPEESLNSLRIVTVFSIDSIVADANRTSLLGLTVIGSSLLVAILLIYGLSYLLTRRMLTLSRNIHSVAQGNFTLKAGLDGNDEVGQLSRRFQIMTRSISGLMDEVQRTTEQKEQLALRQNEIRFKMLASQINPHFLFNTLESIRMKAVMNGQTDLGKVVRQLGMLMRNSLEVGGRLISLSSEMEMVRAYLEIQTFRFEDRLTHELEIDERLKDALIPPLIVQPLVENAVQHGLERKAEGGTVKVSAFPSGQGMLIEVYDNGSGISSERLEQIHSWLSEEDGDEQKRIGMLNVQQRLRLIYGEACGLRVESADGQFTRIHFHIPITKGDRQHV